MPFPSLSVLSLLLPAPKPPPSPPKPTLLSLPPELQHLIIASLPFTATILLRQTCRLYFHLLPPLDSLPALLAAEATQGAADLNLWACALCLRLRRGGRFADRMRRGEWGREVGMRRGRFCVECGVRGRDGDGGVGFNRGEGWTVYGVVFGDGGEGR
ncbi:hypothetical protein MMC30_000936 [Trapelia coarctata]|nr:hypothetical protein [Trapelia coarctata]